jgi:putative transposase
VGSFSCPPTHLHLHADAEGSTFISTTARRLLTSVFYIRTSQSSSGRTNALAETINGLYKTELIKPRKPWRTIEDVEVVTAQWVDWFNHRRLYEYCGDIPPAELEAAYYAQHQRPAAG